MKFVCSQNLTGKILSRDMSVIKHLMCMDNQDLTLLVLFLFFFLLFFVSFNFYF